MHDSDFVIGWINSSTGEVEIADSSHDCETLPLTDLSLGGFDNLFNISGSVIIKQSVNGVKTTYITFSRKTNTGDKYDTVIDDSELFLLWAYGQVVESIPQEHINVRKCQNQLYLWKGKEYRFNCWPWCLDDSWMVFAYNSHGTFGL